jgi:hypothetical protein
MDKDKAKKRLDAALARLGRTHAGRELTEAASGKGLRIRFSGESAPRLAARRRDGKVELMLRRKDFAAAGGAGRVLMLAEGLRLSVHAAAGLELDFPREPDHHLLLARALAADAAAESAHLAHELKRAGDDGPFRALPPELAAVFEDDRARRDPMPALFRAGLVVHGERADAEALKSWRMGPGAALDAVSASLKSGRRDEALAALRAAGLGGLEQPYFALAPQRLAEISRPNGAAAAHGYLARRLLGVHPEAGKPHPLAGFLPNEGSAARAALADDMRRCAAIRAALAGKAPPSADPLAAYARAPAPPRMRRFFAPGETSPTPWRIALERGHAPGKGPGARLLAACPDYRPGRWNNDAVQRSTNCYAYAADDAKGHQRGEKQVPGAAHGRELQMRFDSGEVERLAALDGMIPLGRRPELREGHYLVALALDPGMDFHWYRLGKDGLWSHKMGHDVATDRDENRRPITDPELCNRGRYSEFWGYFLVPEGGLTVGEKARLSPRRPRP